MIWHHLAFFIATQLIKEIIMTATTANEFNATVDAAAKNEGMTAFGCFWRVSATVVLFAAAILAMVYGAQWGIAAIAAMELSALVTTAATWAITGLCYVGVTVASLFISSIVSRVLIAC